MGLMDQAKDFANSEQGEQMTDQAMQTAADAANTATGGQHADKIAQGQQAADGRIGLEGQAAAGDGQEIGPGE